MILIPLTQHQFAMVDEIDFKVISQCHWQLQKGRNTLYARAIYLRDALRGPLTRRPYMHTLIMRPQKGFVVDHINGNGLDNRRSNLRITTSRHNLLNVPKRKGLSSRYKGVCWDKNLQKWHAQIATKPRTNKHLGYFTSEEEAARCYDKAAKQFFGNFAYLNFKS